MPFVSPPYNITAVNDVTASRNFGTQYTNNTGKTMFVFVQASIFSAANGDGAQCEVQTPVGTTILNPGITAGLANLSLQIEAAFPVKPGDTYKVSSVTSGLGQCAKIKWIEAY